MNLTVDFDREADGRLIASVLELAGVHAYESKHDGATTAVQASGASDLGPRDSAH